MRRNGMLNFKYVRLLASLLRRRYLTRYGRRLKTDGPAFVGPDVTITCRPVSGPSVRAARIAATIASG